MVCVASKLIRHIALAVVLGAIVSSAFAAVVTITPTSPGDWSCLSNCHEGTVRAYFTAGGPAPAEGNPFPTDNGAFYADLAWHGDDGETQTDSAWLGLDRHNGQDLAGIPIKKIKTLKYVAYNAGMYNWNMGGSNPRRHCKQPFMVTLTVVCQSTGDRRQFWYRPWGHAGFAHWNNRRAWLTLDALNMTSVPDFSDIAPEAAPPPAWYEPWTDTQFASWNDLINTDPGGGRPTYGDWVLVATSTTFDPANGQYKSPGWDENSTPPGEIRATGTGKCLNLWVGARKAYTTELGSWITESAGFKGYVDSLTLGIDYGTEQSPNVVETTYDFASDDAPATELAVCNIGRARWGSNPPEDHPYARYNPTFARNQNKFIYRFFGKVTDHGVDPDTHEFWFELWDGSYAETSRWVNSEGKVHVRWPWQESPDPYSDPWTWPVQLDDWVSVTGFVYDAWYFQMKPPAEITASPAQTKVHVTVLPE